MKNIYSITLKENKKISPTAPVQTQSESASLGGQSAYSDSQYTQNERGVNPYNPVLGIKENTAAAFDLENKANERSTSPSSQPSNDYYAQNEPVVNTPNSLKLSPEEIKQNVNTAEQYFGTTINPNFLLYSCYRLKMKYPLV